MNCSAVISESGPLCKISDMCITLYRLQRCKPTSLLTQSLCSFNFTHLGESLLVVIFEMQGVDVELVLVGSEWVVVLGLLGEKLLNLHRHPLASVLEGLDRNVRGSHCIWGERAQVLGNQSSTALFLILVSSQRVKGKDICKISTNTQTVCQC